LLLPRVPKRDGIKKAAQVKFGGLNRGLGAADGELADMRNLTGDHFPLLAARGPRGRLLLGSGGAAGGAGAGDSVSALFAHGGLCWAAGGGFYYDGERVGAVSPGRKTFAAMGDYIVILPDKAYYNTYTGKFGSLESEWKGASLTFTNGLLFGEAAEANTIFAQGTIWSDYFSAGDAVEVSGCATRPANNKVAVIREIDGDRMYFYEHAWRLGGAGGDAPYAEAGALSVKRSVPDLFFACENENRLWGCDADTVYASKLGDIFNFNVFEGLATDSYAWSPGSPGRFTACVSFLGYPVFFKEDAVFKVFGSAPENFEVTPGPELGVMEGCAESLAVANETLYYLSRAGVVAYAGGVPRPVGAAFGAERFADAAAGSDGLKYYVSMRRLGGGPGGAGGWLLYAYDSLRGAWHIEDGTRAVQFARRGRDLFFLTDGGEVWSTVYSGALEGEFPGGYEVEGEVRWMAEFADFVDGDPNRKGAGKFQARIHPDEGASVNLFYDFDSGGEWKMAKSHIAPGVKRSYYLPVIPERADHYRLRFEGVGGCRVFSLVRERYSGSENLNERSGEP